MNVPTPTFLKRNEFDLKKSHFAKICICTVAGAVARAVLTFGAAPALPRSKKLSTIEYRYHSTFIIRFTI